MVLLIILEYLTIYTINSFFSLTFLNYIIGQNNKDLLYFVNVSKLKVSLL